MCNLSLGCLPPQTLAKQYLHRGLGKAPSANLLDTFSRAYGIEEARPFAEIDVPFFARSVIRPNRHLVPVAVRAVGRGYRYRIFSDL